MAVHLSLAPPDGCDRWTSAEWDRWLVDHPWEPAQLVGDDGTWLVFLYQVRVHAPKATVELSPYLERLLLQRPIRAAEAGPLRLALRAAADELGRVPASRLWTGTQFYTPEELLSLLAQTEQRTGRAGTDLFVSDLWAALFASLEDLLAQAQAQKRGIYFGHL